MPLKLSFPCLVLDVSPDIVPLPGVSYQFTIPRQQGLKILLSLEIPQLRELTHPDVGEKRDNPEAASILKAAYRKFESEFGAPGKPHIAYVCILPTIDKSHYAGCITALTKFLIEDDLVILSLKGVIRAKVEQFELNLKNEICMSTIVLATPDELGKEWSLEERNEATKVTKMCLEELNSAFREFRSRYKKALREKDDMFGRLLLLSPLANTLFLQLNRAHFIESWELLLESAKNLPTNHIRQADVPSLLCLLDMSASIIPLSPSQRLTFLRQDASSQRLNEFVTLKDKLISLLGDLNSSTEIARSRFEELSAREKASFVALHLSALRSFLSVERKEGKLSKGLDGPRKATSAGLMRSKKVENEFEGDEEDDDFKAIKNFMEQTANIHPDGRKMLHKDYRRLKKMQPQSSEYQILKSYFDVVLDIPFQTKATQIGSVDILQCQSKLDSDHFGLRNVKKRLIEYLAVLKVNEDHPSKEPKTKAPILLLVGPPGVGKTSIAKSVAEVLNRKFHRISLGGIYNEADIRGHRRTYVGSMCGMIINALRKSGSMKPLILLDEIDKVLSLSAGGRGAGLNGDPGAALLEVLDPEQNATFTDHYVGFPVDLSDVLFFCTANELEGISAPLLNRMEVIEIPGYTIEEKVQIGKKFLLPKQVRLNGLDKIDASIKLTDETWDKLVEEYTREPGVRSLERKLAGLVRGRIVEYLEGAGTKQEIAADELIKYLGFPPHSLSKDLIRSARFADKNGVVSGLAYNSDGSGGVLVFEVVRTGQLENEVKGPRVRTTGNLGKLLNESIDIAVALVKSLSERKIIIGPEKDPFQQFMCSDLHLHVPMGAVSKDGPSAGVAITLALLSLALGIPVPSKLCMTGEITSRGKVLPIGGVKEKLLGARRFGMKKVLVPLANRTDVIQAAMDPDQFESCLTSSDHPELLTIKNNWQLDVSYVDDLFDAISYSWPTRFQIRDNSLLMLPSTRPLRPSL
ncbi:LADA_0G01640g1_1 [Lachancea dasiensis]|uniref:endopeptidase La n=1 Tax=Lachancea dasiensis TaxID=1072105 RepID=A0A1G4JR19_9SACH|nr:LADA_0G01640g1_1 [Lachancea dasiensis]